jgi:hypothetical protein
MHGERYLPWFRCWYMFAHRDDESSFMKSVFIPRSCCLHLSEISFYHCLSFPTKGGVMDAHWLIFGSAILGVPVTAIVVFEKGQQTSQ